MLPLCRQKRKPDYNKLIPLVYAPALPLCKLIYAQCADLTLRCSNMALQ